MSSKNTRRSFLLQSSVGGLGLMAVAPALTARRAHASSAPHLRALSRPRFPIGSAEDRGKLVAGLRTAGSAPPQVITPDIEQLPYTMDGNVKQFELMAEHLEREVLPDKWINFWGYNDSMPGPTIQANQGDRVRIVVENRLPEPTTVHWHGLEVPVEMDGVEYISQDPIMPGEQFVYEFDLHQHGTFFYHSHGPMQQSIGMVGLFIIHPADPISPVVDRDFALLTQEFALLPKSTVPSTLSESFNLFTLNGRAAPYVTPMLVRRNERVRIRFINLSTMDHHPMHVHGHTFWITGTEGGRIPETAWIPGNTVLVPSGGARDVEFIASNPGDWLVHCHVPHHMMNHMVPTVGPPGVADGPVGSESRWQVPGFPQDQMDAEPPYDEWQIDQLNVPETQGLPPEWYRGMMGMTTILRVLEDDDFAELAAASSASY